MRQQEGYYHIVLTEMDERVDLATIDEQKRRLCAAFRDFMARRGWAYEMLICPSFVKVIASGQRRKAHPHIHILLHAQACSSAAQFIRDYWHGQRGRGQRIGQANKYLCLNAPYLRDKYLPNQAEGGKLWRQAYNADSLESSEAIIEVSLAEENARQSAIPAASAPIETPLRDTHRIVFLINNIGAYMGEQGEADGPPSPACCPVPHAHEGPGASAEGHAEGQRHPSGSARQSGARRGHGLGIWGQPTVQMRQQNGKARGWGLRSGNGGMEREEQAERPPPAPHCSGSTHGRPDDHCLASPPISSYNLEVTKGGAADAEAGAVRTHWPGVGLFSGAPEIHAEPSGMG